MTQRREAILSFIVEYRKAGNGSPTYKEIADHIGITVSGVQDHLERLVKDNRIVVLKGIPRGIRVNG